MKLPGPSVQHVTLELVRSRYNLSPLTLMIGGTRAAALPASAFGVLIPIGNLAAFPRAGVR
jgi:hypothetical protein